jgi:hypothetical protein
MSEHEELVKELREVLGRIPDDIADNLPLTFLRSCLAVLQGSTGEKAMNMSEYGLTSTVYKELLHQRELNAELLEALEEWLYYFGTINEISIKTREIIAKAKGEEK